MPFYLFLAAQGSFRSNPESTKVKNFLANLGDSLLSRSWFQGNPGKVFIEVSTSNHANTYHNNRDMGNIDTDMYNMDMERDRRKRAPVVLDEWLQHIQKENSAKATSQLFFSLAISFHFMEDSLCFPCSLSAANIKARDFTNQIFDFFLLIYKTHGS